MRAATQRGVRDPIDRATAHWRARGWDTGPYFAAALAVTRVEGIIRAANERILAPHGLTHARHEALTVLHFAHDGRLPLSVLSRRLMLHPTSVTSTVDTLERLGFVERRSHPVDRRITLATITRAGRRAVEASNAALVTMRFELHELTEADAGRVHAALLPVRRAAGDVTSTADPVQVAAARWRERGWPAGPHFEAALSILRVEELVRESSDEALRPYRLTDARHEALALLAFSQREELSLGTLSSRLMIHPSSVTGTVDALVRLGYAERVAHPDDRRTTLARITDQGRQVFAATCEARVRQQFGVGALGPTRARTVHRLLTPVRRAAGDLDPVR